MVYILDLERNIVCKERLGINYDISQTVIALNAGAQTLFSFLNCPLSLLYPRHPLYIVSGITFPPQDKRLFLANIFLQ